MAKLELSRELALTPDEAWVHVSDLGSLGDWLVMHEGWRSELPDELSVGTTIVGVAGAKGLRNRVTWTIQKFDPPKLIEVTGKGCGRHEVRTHDEGGGDRNRLHVHPHHESRGSPAVRADRGHGGACGQGRHRPVHP